MDQLWDSDKKKSSYIERPPRDVIYTLAFKTNCHPGTRSERLDEPFVPKSNKTFVTLTHPLKTPFIVLSAEVCEHSIVLRNF